MGWVSSQKDICGLFSSWPKWPECLISKSIIWCLAKRFSSYKAVDWTDAQVHEHRQCGHYISDTPFKKKKKISSNKKLLFNSCFSYVFSIHRISTYTSAHALSTKLCLKIRGYNLFLSSLLVLLRFRGGHAICHNRHNVKFRIYL